jgi:hypothetical protein
MFARRGICAAARGGDNHAQTIWDAVAPATPVSFTKKVSDASYIIYQQNGQSRFMEMTLNALAGMPAGYSPPLAINRINTVVPYLLVVNEDASWAYTGTWTVFSGSHRSVIAGDRARFTSPAGTVAMGLNFATASNTGYAKVIIDDDPTRATLLTTAQEEVDAGRLPSTVLVANGGTLNPTDRVADTSTFTSGGANRHVADELAPGVHTMDVFVTGYKRSSATDLRVAILGAYYHSSSVTPATASVVIMEDARIMWANSNHEFAYYVKIGGVTEWTGSIPHGYEEVVSTEFLSDGVPVTMTNGQVIQNDESFVVNRTTKLHHPNAVHMADKELSYTFDGSGLRVQHNTDWLTSAEISAAYEAMLPTDGISTNGSTETFTRGSGSAISSDVELDLQLFPGETPFDTTTGESDQMWMWSTGTNRHVMAAKMADPETTLQGYAYVSSLKSFLQDRSGLNKAYWTLKTNGEGPAMFVANGTHWESDTTYRWAVVTDANGLCSRT